MTLVKASDTRQAKRFAKAMKASLIFSSTSHSINVQKVSLRFSQIPAVY